MFVISIHCLGKYVAVNFLWGVHVTIVQTVFTWKYQLKLTHYHSEGPFTKFQVIPSRNTRDMGF